MSAFHPITTEQPTKFHVGFVPKRTATEADSQGRFVGMFDSGKRLYTKRYSCSQPLNRSGAIAV
jgi:hypothetical protein